jgi:hypothetical protein
MRMLLKVQVSTEAENAVLNSILANIEPGAAVSTLVLPLLFGTPSHQCSS